jgi:hypothetical protein
MYVNEMCEAVLLGFLGRALVLDIYTGFAWAAELRVHNYAGCIADLLYHAYLHSDLYLL